MKRTLAILLSLAMVFALFGTMTVSVSAQTVTKTMTLTADDVNYIKGKNHKISATKVVGNAENGDDFLVRFNMSSSMAYSDTSFGISIPTSIFDLDVTKITYVLRTNSTFKTNQAYLYMTNQSYLTNNSSSPTVAADNIVLLQNYFDVSNNTEGTKKTIDLTTSANANIKNKELNVLAFGRKNSGGDTTSSSANQLDILSITVEYNEESSTSPITMLDGAAMRIDGATEGIRFEASVDKTAFDAATSGGTVTEIGTLIAKDGTDISNVIVDNATEVKNDSTELSGNQIPVAKYPSDAGLQEVVGTDKYIIVGSLVEIKDTNANQKYVARAYVKYTDAEGNPQVMYADALSTARSLAGVAYAIQTEAGENTYYKQLCEEHKAVVDGWADKLA